MSSDFAVATAFALNGEKQFNSQSAVHPASLGLRLLDRLGCVLRGPLDYQGPFVAIMHGLTERDVFSGEMGKLRRQYLRLHVLNVTDDLQRRFRVVMRAHNKSQSLMLPVYVKPQERRDGWATVLKLFAWSLVQYRMLLLVDLDVLLIESPEPALRHAIERRITFHAAREPRVSPNPRVVSGYTGVRTHLVLLRPSADVYTLLMNNALRGHLF